QIAFYIWIIALGTFIIRAITSDEKIAEQASLGKTVLETAASPSVVAFGWMKCLFVSGISLFLTIIILGLLLGI
ncbi:MAG: hypothetical protein QXP44_06240, partial [Candidatus Bathyarchaeia archaeon]